MKSKTNYDTCNMLSRVLYLVSDDIYCIVLLLILSAHYVLHLVGVYL